MKDRLIQWIVMAVIFAVTISCNEKSIQSYSIEKGNFRQSFIETGELAAVDTRSFILPRYGRYWYQMKIIGLLDHGTEVKAGDSIIQLDPIVVFNRILEMETELETQAANLEKLLVNQSNRLSEIESSLKNEEASFNLKKLEMEYSKFESERIQKVRGLEFNQAKIRYSNVQQSMNMNKIIAENDLKIQMIRVRQLKEDIKSTKEIIPMLTIRTPIPGIFQIGRNRRSDVLLKIGDEIYQGNNMGNVPDLAWMKVNTSVNETDFFKIGLGQKVVVRLDATPSVSFQGEVAEIGKLCYQKDTQSRQKIFDVVIRLLVSDYRLKPGMTVNTEFLCNELANVLYVPINCVEHTGSGSFIYVEKGGSLLRTEVDAGPVNNTHCVIKGDVQKGQQVVPISQIEQKETK